MFGFKRSKPNPTPSAEDPAVEADLQEAIQVKVQCEVGTGFARRISDPDEDQAQQRAHYERIRDRCLLKIRRIEDEFSRNFATHQLIKLCVIAGDVAIGRALFISVNDDMIREKIIEDCPILET